MCVKVTVHSLPTTKWGQNAYISGNYINITYRYMKQVNKTSHSLQNGTTQQVPVTEYCQNINICIKTVIFGVAVCEMYELKYFTLIPQKLIDIAQKYIVVMKN